MQVVAIFAAFMLANAARVDAKHVEEQLNILRPPLTDDGEANPAVLVTAVTPHADVTVSLEDAAQVIGYLEVRCRPKSPWDTYLGAPRSELPTIDEVS